MRLRAVDAVVVRRFPAMVIGNFEVARNSNYSTIRALGVLFDGLYYSSSKIL